MEVAMPQYEYLRLACNKKFSLLLTVTEHDKDSVKCPKCKSPKVEQQWAAVNQRFAAKFWPGEDPIGKRLRLFSGATAQPWLTIVGVVPNIVQNDIAPRQIDPLIYLPYRERPQADRVGRRDASTGDPSSSYGMGVDPTVGKKFAMATSSTPGTDSRLVFKRS
jgi:putative FmdB family regulatory protein